MNSIRAAVCGLTVLVLAFPLAAQQPREQWEYGRLFVTHGIPMVWWTREGIKQIDSGTVVMRAEPVRQMTSDTAAARRPFRVLLQTLNELGAEGWEWVSTTSNPPYDQYYWFKRRKP